MHGLLSVKTVVPKPRGRVWYADQHAAADAASVTDTLRYSFTGADPANARNQWLLDAARRRLPIVYLYGVAPAAYEPLFPVFVEEWDDRALCVSLRVGPDASTVGEVLSEDLDARRYATRLARQRLHQAAFREQVLDAYGGRCALSGLPEARLLEAAHIVADGDEALGHPDVRNGILMSRLHHGAFDAGLIGIDGACRIHVSAKLLGLRDGPTLGALTELHGTTVRLPRDVRFRPDPRRLAARFALFLGNAARAAR